jgi:hypothetical protein
MTLQEIKAALLGEASLRDLTEGGSGKILKGVRDMPVKKMIDAANYIDKELLPAVKKKSGDKSADYEFFSNVFKYLLYGITLVDRYEQLESRWVSQKVEMIVLRDHLELMTRELGKYNALEDLYMTDALDIYAKRVKDAADARLNKLK